MGLFDSLSSSVAGMQAQTFALQNISGNIANSQTPAYKTTDTSFQDLLNSQGSADQSSGGVQAQSKNNNTLQGAIQTAKTSTYMAVQGDGYFTVQKPSAVASGGQPSISNSSPVYTRRGDFQTDSNGYLVNGAGYYLMGNPVDPSTGNATGGAPQALQVNAANLPTNEGKLESLSINSKGQLQGTFSSGKTVSLAEIPLSTFNGQNFLKQGDGGTYTPTTASGTAIAGATGQIVGSSLEASNTDISNQFTSMIMAQQAYGANTKTMASTNQMLQTLTRL